MRIVSVTGTTYSDFVTERLSEAADADILVLGFGVIGDIDFRNEIQGDGSLFADICVLSGDLDCVVVAAAMTDVYGVRHRSAVVADRGELLDVSDMVHVLPGENALANGIKGGSCFRVYDTCSGKLGVIVDRDIMFPESGRILAVNDCSLFINVLDDAPCGQSLLALQAAALHNGVPAVQAAEGRLCFSDSSGRITLDIPGQIAAADISAEKDNRFLSSRRTGLYRAMIAPFEK